MTLSDLFAKKDHVLFLDGGLASELERNGNDLNHFLWSGIVLINNPEEIEKVHLSYLNSGVNIITTSSYQLCTQGLMNYGLSQIEAEKIMVKSVLIAFQSIDTYKKIDPHFNRELGVAISLGCYGAFLHDGSEYNGNYTISDEDLIEFHYKRICIYQKYSYLWKDKNYIYAFETIPNQREAHCIIKAINKSRAPFPCWISFACCDASHINSNESIIDIIDTINICQDVKAVGVNCTNPKYILNLIQIIKQKWNKRIIVYPNLGEDWDKEKQEYVIHSGIQSIKEYALLAESWYHEGATLLGGCCRTTPEIIKEVIHTISKDI
ncbi:hypothetical protein WA158_005589 [Blastocystis sp. Blastoise]